MKASRTLVPSSSGMNFFLLNSLSTTSWVLGSLSFPEINTFPICFVDQYWEKKSKKEFSLIYPTLRMSRFWTSHTSLFCKAIILWIRALIICIFTIMKWDSRRISHLKMYIVYSTKLQKSVGKNNIFLISQHSVSTFLANPLILSYYFNT